MTRAVETSQNASVYIMALIYLLFCMSYKEFVNFIELLECWIHDEFFVIILGKSYIINF